MAGGGVAIELKAIGQLATDQALASVG